ncbi:chromosome segregation protein SMC [Zavarzinia sp. CC-PAN008]|uniref:chromosome segregation protein SMC n=1 Tax=Zavarzinia sp. CC-PAN008 TaxID=3243332 RepID=UPI003F746DE3
MRFTRLRLSGFKSFVEPSELVIAPGLTGIVGPNGCGKSNLLEALRWVMGESSARLVRGTEMNDVIFAGTTSRQAKPFAEVALALDNDGHDAPAAFNELDELEVSRKITRDVGSTYRVNGKEVRARDVQLLFADAATGARSPALVGQGRIAAIIAAKPAERRAVLEEAAGIGGLHARRHEAELKLKGAEANLERVDDLIGGLETQVAALKRQGRQATRYRNLAADIRKAEALLLHMRHREAAGAIAATAATLREAEALVVRLTAEAAAAATVEAGIAAGLPALRSREAELAQSLHAARVERDGLALEERRVGEARQRLANQVVQAERDRAREQALVEDAAQAQSRLGQERAELEAQRGAQPALEAAAQTELEAAGGRLSAAEAQADQAARRLAERDAAAAALQRELDDLKRKRQRSLDDQRRLAGERDRLGAEQAADPAMDDATGRIATLEAQLADGRAALDAAEAAARDSEPAEAQAQAQARKAEADVQRCASEAKGLRQVLSSGRSGRHAPILDQVSVAPGYEAAFGAALGEDVEAPLDQPAPVRWTTLPPYDAAPSLPPSVEALADKVQAPPALARRLSQVGIVLPEQGPALAAQLQPGQCLVTRKGALWRWDGFQAAAEAPSAAAIRLAQRNRLGELEAEQAQAEAVLANARTAHEAARAARATANAQVLDRRQALRGLEDTLARLREAAARAARVRAEREAKLAALAESMARVERDAADVAAALAAAESRAAALPPRDALEQARTALAREVGLLRSALAEKRGQLESLRREALARAKRIEAVTAEDLAWTRRRTAAEGQIATFDARVLALRAEAAELEDRPAQLAEARMAAETRIAAGENARNAAAQALGEAEADGTRAHAAVRAVEAALADARERRIRAEGAAEQAAGRLADLEAAITERLGLSPRDLADAAGLDAADDLPPADGVEQRLDKLKRDRDAMGPVNLRADVEAEEIGREIVTLQTERADLTAAIARLRQAIGALNREGREKLAAAFDAVNQHFGEVFQKLFGGGRAHLVLSESDDPLEAGLEIMASPPGKKLQSLGLLSGGEQALTALSLIVAVFLTNPAPICVLDEVDAPLDDANVQRFCDLLEDVARRTQTRFLVVTHHSLTMSRMDRLYGVTMAERGVSRLVSVELARAPVLRAAE